MATVTFNAEKLGNCQKKLSDLCVELTQISTSTPAQVGRGSSIDALTAVSKKYSEIQSALYKMMTNTLAFFREVEKSVQYADDTAATKLRGE